MKKSEKMRKLMASMAKPKKKSRSRKAKPQAQVQEKPEEKEKSLLSKAAEAVKMAVRRRD